MEFDHNTQTSFALRGMHQDVACTGCHVDLVFSKAPTQCSECHADLHRRQFGANCQQCHTVQGWNVQVSAVQDHNNRFPLLGAHAAVVCESCHRGAASGVFTGLSTDCVTCHQKDYQSGTPLNHVSAHLPTTCRDCHDMNQWSDPGTLARFNHAQFTGAVLVGQHSTSVRQCVDCHVGGNFNLAADKGNNCIQCHLADYNGANNPPHRASGFPLACGQCHGTSASTWTTATFDHATTGFPLAGAHATVQCAQCHVNGNYTLTSTACAGCHLPDYANATNPNHKTSNFPTTCEQCHNVTSWLGAQFNHAITGFALTGAHTSLACTQCHVNNNYTLTSAACWNCHQTDYKGATNPNHVQANFPQDCTGCHTTTTWLGAQFNHASTGFALTGAHNSLQCVQCHVGGNYGLTSAACWNCHQNDYNSTTNPNHRTANLPQDCSVCHTTTNWGGAQFNHASTGFALIGAHATAQCAQCHVNGNYSLTSGDCMNCHAADYNGTTNPPHKAQAFPSNCDGCHNMSNWLGATFNHASTGFPLTGAHGGLQCASCHVSNNFNLTSTACITCHQTDYNNTTIPVHKTAGFPQDCTLCHTTATWQGATFNHATTGFALTGAHVNLQCAQCHTNNNYTLSSGACITCHQTDYNNTNNPPHKSANFPTDCSGCHTTTDWTGATFNHATTGFALTGAHSTQACTACHVNNNYTLSSGACWNCHQTDYNGANNPPHAASNFPQDCSTCHSTTNWTSATFNHATTGFALVGVHGTQACTACHVNNNYGLTAANTACYSCHATDYAGAMNPPHAASNFPQDCTLCHGTSITNWTSATFDHSTTGFALVGFHSTNVACAQCHVNNNYSLTSANAACYSCHATDYNNTNNPPHAASGYPTDCSGCHQVVAGWTGATFNHATTGFALTGAHLTQACTACHVNNNFNLTSALCYNCHSDKYNSAMNPPHAAANFPQDCSTCHSTTDWTSSTWTHPTSPLALTGYHLTNMLNANPPLCGSCHVGNNYTSTPSDCWSCHQTDYNGTSNPAHGAAFSSVANAAHVCSDCHTFTNWTGAKYTAHDTSTPGPFPIYSGRHNGNWQNCTDCHPSSTDYSNATVTCISACHPASKIDAVGDHKTQIAKLGVTVFNQGMTCIQAQCHARGTTP